MKKPPEVLDTAMSGQTCVSCGRDTEPSVRLGIESETVASTRPGGSAGIVKRVALQSRRHTQCVDSAILRSAAGVDPDPLGRGTLEERPSVSMLRSGRY